jgi:hypothetical protein
VGSLPSPQSKYNSATQLANAVIIRKFTSSNAELERKERRKETERAEIDGQSPLVADMTAACMYAFGC